MVTMVNLQQEEMVPMVFLQQEEMLLFQMYHMETVPFLLLHLLQWTPPLVTAARAGMDEVATGGAGVVEVTSARQMEGPFTTSRHSCLTAGSSAISSEVGFLGSAKCTSTRIAGKTLAMESMDS